MPKFEGCVKGTEISLCPKTKGGGANPHAHVLVLKTLSAPGADTKTETIEMSTEAEKAAAAARTAEINKAAREISNKIAGMSDVTKAYYLALPDDKQDAFLAKSADEMKVEAETAKAEADKKAAEEEAAKSGVTPQMLALQKSNAALAAEVETLKAAQVERDLEKRAHDEFDGFPGGPAAVVQLLKAYAKLDEPARKASEDLLKAQAATAKQMSKTFGGRTEQDLTKADAAKGRIEEATQKAMVDKKMSREDAWEWVIEQPEYAQDVAAIG